MSAHFQLQVQEINNQYTILPVMYTAKGWFFHGIESDIGIKKITFWDTPYDSWRSHNPFDNFSRSEVEAYAIPIPTTLLLLGTGLAGLLALKKRNRRLENGLP